MRWLAILYTAMATSATADTFDCELSGLTLTFEIDMTQFAPALDPNEPLRRRVTTVQIGDAQIAAEPLVIGNLRGFWTDTADAQQLLLIIQPDGTASLTNGPDGTERIGDCRLRN